ncbi:MAG: AI-2E family transporter, partial [Gammaproteobacteria bacterium]
MKEKAVQGFNKSLIAVLVALLICGYFLYSVSEILTPFLIGLALAYFLSPLVDKLQTLKIPRPIGAILSIGLVVLLVVGLSLTLAPIIGHQIEVLRDKLADSNLKISDITDSVHGYIASADAETIAQVEDGIKSISKELLSFAGRLIQTVVTSGLVAFNILSIIFITPIVMYYLMVSWNDMVGALQNLVPKHYRKTSNRLFTEINTTLSGYIRGQSLVCLIMGVLYAFGLLAIGLESAIALG